MDVNISHDFGPLRLAILQSTTFCNIDCDYCYLPDRDERNVMDLPTIRKVFERLLESGICDSKLTVVWHAGEPLTMPLDYYEAAFQEIQSIVAGAFAIQHCIQTNATLVDRRWCEFLLRHSVRVGVSLDGPQFIHDAHRKRRGGKGTFAAALAGYRLLKQSGIEPGVISVISEATLGHVQSFHDFFVGEGTAWLGLNLEETEGVHTASTLLHSKHELAWYNFVRKLFALTRASKLRVREFENATQSLRARGATFDEQSTPFAIASFSHLGDFSTFSPELLGATHFGRSFVLGNVYCDDLLGSLNSKEYGLISSEIRAGVAECQKSCAYFEHCGGGIPSNKMFELGTFSGTETLHCRFRKKLLVEAILRELEVEMS